MNSFGSLIYSILLYLSILCTICFAVGQPAPTPAPRTANGLSGTWAGTMSISDDQSRREDITLSIPRGCQAGAICGYIDNTTVSCRWEVKLLSIEGQTMKYEHARTLSGACPAIGTGTLTLQADGTLMREHVTPRFTSSGLLTRVGRQS